MNDIEIQGRILDKSLYQAAKTLQESRRTGTLPGHEVKKTADILRAAATEAREESDKFFEGFKKKRSARRIAFNKQTSSFLEKRLIMARLDKLIDAESLKSIEKQLISSNVRHKALSNAFRKKYYYDRKRGK